LESVNTNPVGFGLLGVPPPKKKKQNRTYQKTALRCHFLARRHMPHHTWWWGWDWNPHRKGNWSHLGDDVVVLPHLRPPKRWVKPWLRVAFLVKLEVKDVERWMNTDEHGWKWKTLLENEWTLEMTALCYWKCLIKSVISCQLTMVGDR